MTGTMTDNILLTRLQGKKLCLLTGGIPKDPYRRRHERAEEGRMTPTLPPFVRPGCSTHLLLNVMRSKHFYRIDFDPQLVPKIQNQIAMRKVFRHTIPSFACSKSPFELQPGSRETPHASHPETEEERCPRRNQRRAARAAWVRCEPSTPRRDPKTGTRSVVEGVLSRFSIHWRSEDNQACLLGPLCVQAEKG